MHMDRFGRLISTFCQDNIKSEVTFSDKNGTRTEWRCKEHAAVILVAYTNGNNITTWACPSCLDELYESMEKPIQDCKQRAMPANANVIGCRVAIDATGKVLCEETENLEMCSMCGELSCPTHRVETVCDDCAEKVEVSDAHLCCGPF